MSPLNISHHSTDRGPVLRVVGDLDHAQTTALRERIDDLVLGPGRRLVIELSGLDFCDSTGITALLAARRHAQAAGADMVLTGVPADTMRVLTTAGLDQVFTIR
ncbi:STAS domain-containing protein [Streptomyces montanisoli]|uniref:Anti-sigma factor antagonist n=1 Tax=Streptomyces montanisoli TaxID=2798581 RepID=A0A940M4M1_9ACTN|nr:STAS domain-containing protein [Streptomyces montanisoli]MBP0456029.1 STAS domain-containing protein [Streptomyces montanisoli]